tara:strand:+ start:1547 stop:2041 length:495 start_codon:yes stop_codon:yes gene_type:complete
METKKITFGSYTNDKWKTINGLDSVKHVIDQMKELDWGDHKLYAVGSILSQVDTHDLDLIITGPIIPGKINYLLEEIVEIGFDEQIYCDVKFSVSGDLYNPEVDTTKTIRYANYKPLMYIDGHPYHFAKESNGLYLSDRNYPMAKTLNAMADEGRKYRAPFRLI